MATNRYIVLLKDKTKSSVKKVEDDFEVSVMSSEDLSKEKRSFDIIDKDNTVLYKNLNVMVTENISEEQLNKALYDPKNPVIYYEKEREFSVANETDIIRELKTKTTELSTKIAELENYLQKKPASSVNSMDFNDYEWGLSVINLSNTNLTGKGVDICILDTGIDMLHPDFADREIEGKSFVPNQPWDADVHGHGTHCAGVAAGNLRSDTGKRYGVAKDCNLKIAKVLANNGKGSTGSIVDAIDWAITKKFRIISLSLASPVKNNEKPSPLFEAIGQKALENNCLIIAAAGNDSKRPAVPYPVSAPANSVSVLAVAAIDSKMHVASFSNAGINPLSGGNINVCAPGVNIVSSYPKKSGTNLYYKSMSGTSMATPHVSGVAALYMEKDPALTAIQIWEILEKNAKQLIGQKYRDIGSGLVQII